MANIFPVKFLFIYIYIEKMILIYDFPLSQLQAFPEERQLAQILTLSPLALFSLATCIAKIIIF